MVGAYHNLNGSLDLTIPLSGFAICGLTLTFNISTEFEVSISNNYEDNERRYKMSKWGRLG